jgi:cyclase
MNPTYPYIDAGTSCKIAGMIAVVDNYTRIVAGHGLLGNTADLTKSRDMLITSCDRVQKLPSAQEEVAEKAFADLDPVWGQGIINSDQWIQIVDLTP